MKYVSWLISAIVAVVLVIIGANLINRQIKTVTQPSKPTSLVSFEDYLKPDTKLQYRIIGPVVADGLHREIHMEITASNRTLKIIKGYNGQIESETKLGNNYNAYEVFAQALYNEGFSKARKVKDDRYAGQCPNGIRYELSVVKQDANDQKTLWHTTCSTKYGTYAGSKTDVRSLFKKQFEEYSLLTKGVSL